MKEVIDVEEESSHSQVYYCQSFYRCWDLLINARADSINIVRDGSESRTYSLTALYSMQLSAERPIDWSSIQTLVVNCMVNSQDSAARSGL